MTVAGETTKNRSLSLSQARSFDFYKNCYVYDVRLELDGFLRALSTLSGCYTPSAVDRRLIAYEAAKTRIANDLKWLPFALAWLFIGMRKESSYFPGNGGCLRRAYYSGNGILVPAINFRLQLSDRILIQCRFGDLRKRITCCSFLNQHSVVLSR